MYDTIRGKLTRIHPSGVTIEAAGVGYAITTPLSLYAKLPKEGEELQLFVSFIVRELSQALYGFTTEKERFYFEQMIAISGIGPKVAMSLLSHLTPSQFESALQCRDVDAISRVPGIGKKTAERILMELGDKLKKGTKGAKQPPVPIFDQLDSRSQTLGDAIAALINLGYSSQTAQSSVERASKGFVELKESDLAALITGALKAAT